tara:strand:- start:539 stop:943 length:405 start_codon:yes stop_codon:yes gene_type:complete
MRFVGQIQGSRRIRQQLRRLKVEEQTEIAAAIKKSTDETRRVAKVLAPELTGETRDFIKSKIYNGGMKGVVYAGETRPEKDKAYAVEFGRKPGVHGSTDPQSYIRRAQSYIAKKHKGRMRRAMNKAIKRAMGNG